MMLRVDAQSVVSDIKPFNQFSQDHVDQAIEMAKTQADNDDIPENKPDFRMAVLNLARHYLNVDAFAASGGVTQGKVMQQSQTRADPNSYDDHYLKAYNNIADDYGGSGGDITFMNGEHDSYLL